MARVTCSSPAVLWASSGISATYDGNVVFTGAVPRVAGAEFDSLLEVSWWSQLTLDANAETDEEQEAADEEIDKQAPAASSEAAAQAVMQARLSSLRPAWFNTRREAPSSRWGSASGERLLGAACKAPEATDAESLADSELAGVSRRQARRRRGRQLR